MTQFDLFAALRWHWEWRVRLRLAAKGLDKPPDTRTVADPTACELGGWLAAESRVHGGLESLAELEAAHADFHAVAAEVAGRIAAGDREGVEALLAPETRFDHASNAVVLAILKLMRDLSEG